MLKPGKHELHTAAELKAESRRWIDAEILKLQAIEAQREGRRNPKTGKREPPEAPSDELTRAVAAKAHLWRTGSFRHLEVALELLGVTYPDRLASIRVFLIDQNADPSPTILAHLDETIDWLAARLPRPILLPADAIAEIEVWKRSLENGRTADHRRQREQRDVEILDLVETHGWSLRRIGRIYALSPEGVRLALNRVTTRIVVASAPAA